MQVRGSRGWTRPLVASLLALVALLGATAPAAADSESELRKAEQFEDQAERTETQIAASRQRLADLGRQASAALEAYQAAQVALRAAEHKAATAERDLAAAASATAEQRGRLGGYAATAYRSGGTEDIALFTEMVTSATPNGLIQGVGVLERVGDKQAQMLLAFQVAQHREAEARMLAESTAEAAAEKAKEAAAAKARADDLVRQQDQQVAALEAELDRILGKEARARAEAARLKRAEAIAARAVARIGPVGSCRGGSTSGYSNGRLPESALCPLWGAPGHRLRADAAAGFNAMSRAFALEFGRPICVSSSYRSYDQQAAVYAAKPGLAAPPGQSNHGWGLAADLCGGVEHDGTAVNNWLRANAGRWSWFHPSWADSGGSGPYEPWHWEYAGG